MFNAGIALWVSQTGQHYLHQVGSELHKVTAEDMPLIKIISKITNHQLEQSIHFERAAKYAGIQVNNPRQYFKKEVEKFEALGKKVSAEIIEAEKLAEHVLEIESDPVIVEEFQHVLKALKQIESEYSSFQGSAKEALTAFERGNTVKASQLSQDIEKAENKFIAELTGLLTEVENFTEKALKTVEQHEIDAEKKLNLVKIKGLIASFIVSALIIVGVSWPMMRMKKALYRMADGFNARLPKVMRHSEMGQIIDALQRIGNNLDAINKTQAVISFDMDGTILTANDLFLKTMGYKLEEIVGKHHSMFAPPGVAESQAYKDFWAKLNRGEFDTGEYKRIAKDGSEVWISASYNPILNSDGVPTRVTKFAEDITEEVKRRHEIEMISLVAEKSDNSVVITDANGLTEYVNNGFTRLTGYTLEDIKGKKPGELLQGKDTNPETVNQIRECIKAKEPFYEEILNYAKDGQAYWISLSINPVFDDNGNLIRFISIQGDVTANKLGYLEDERGMNEAVAVLENLAEGGLDKRMEGEYTRAFKNIKIAVNETIDKIKNITMEIVDATNAVKSASSEIADGSQDLAHRTEQQASTLEETAAAMEQLTGAVRQNTENAIEANKLSSDTKADAERGGEIVKKSVEAVGTIKQSSEKISQIITTIEDIAFQTNLLALNAAVEAARAGEAGKGFAVVASEVRALAGRSADASKEISDLINKSVQDVNVGTELVNKSGESLQQIVTSVEKVAALIESIASASQEQSKGVDEINVAVSQIDETTQQNAALVEESTAASRSLAEQADRLSQLIGFFKLNSDQATSSKSSSLSTKPDLAEKVSVNNKEEAKKTKTQKDNSKKVEAKKDDSKLDSNSPDVSQKPDVWEEF